MADKKSQNAIANAQVVSRPPGRARFVPIGSQEDEETEKTPRERVKRPSGSKGSE